MEGGIAVQYTVGRADKAGHPSYVASLVVGSTLQDSSLEKVSGRIWCRAWDQEHFPQTLMVEKYGVVTNPAPMAR